MEEEILKISDLKTCFYTKSGKVTAVDGVSLSVRKGECLGIVGESGSGKSVTFASVMGLIKSPGVIESGSILFRNRELAGADRKTYQKIRGKEIAMTMQDALTALNPAYTVSDQITEVITAHDNEIKNAGRNRKRLARDKALEMMRLVGIPSAEDRLNDYPHQFSGGMRQRIMIAIALVCGPVLLIADEPTTALDVTIQAQVLELIEELRLKLGMSVVLITHDLGVVARYCERVVVMYAGQIVESGPTRLVLNGPAHPYTAGLLKSIPDPEHPERKIIPIPGSISDGAGMTGSCRFLPRCASAGEECRKIIPMVGLTDGRESRCVLSSNDG